MNNLFQVIVVWMACLVCMVSANHTILVILGCADSSIQEERVNSAMEYLSKTNATIKIYVSGGVKDAILSSNKDKDTEASRMANSFENKGIEIVLKDYMSEFQASVAGGYFIALYFGIQTNYIIMLKDYMTSLI